MSKEDREALVVYVLFLLFLLGLFVLLVVSESPTPEPQKFSVVDTYKGCSVVKFIPPGDAKSHYFLDCSK